MAMNAVEIENLILEELPNAKITIHDLAGDGNHYAAEVVDPEFSGKSRIQQHQRVYAALKGSVGRRLHALTIQTRAHD
ncbi:BolA/IbaG family iron-sulfur metabolism protein [Candidatus Endowatersipora endosymbiont of Watersipora subatra]|uniref:BolA/IbaG family iron-sulfur metabolism protein n=1 Tax=Candidatus Endowatersipora endosymbiont of Watersipora subatra TaxID=3077946 RepID=UPI00312C7070